MIEIGDKVISTRILERKFVCDLSACRGACCVEGNGGAPLTLEEIDQLEAHLEDISVYMRPEGIQAVERAGVFYVDQENEPATTLVNGNACAFVFFDGNGAAKCAVEKAYSEGKIPFNKPISCHLYPIRVKQFETFTALNYHEWDVCAPACACGEKLEVPVYRFLKEPIIRAFGEAFFNELVEVEKEIKEKGLGY
ncbi:MAG: DUF3109 family protein [Bacteroidota bacterium]